jgi:hypothetical protein
MFHGFAHIGGATTTLEAVAGAIGAGILVSSFAIALLGISLGWPRQVLERRVFRNGYVGGLLGVAAVVLDLLTRHVV